MTLTYAASAQTSRLRPGPSRISRGQVTEIQRGRMLAAAVDAVDEVGYAGMTVAQVIGRARVSRKTFYDVFADREDCFLAALDQALEQAGEIVGEAYRAESSWREGVRAGLASLLALMDDEPALTKLCVVEALAAGDRVLERRCEAMEQLAAAVDAGRREDGALDPPEVTAEGVVGAVFQIVHTRVLEKNSAPLFELLGPLMSMIVLPYLGTHAADRELGLTSARPEPRRSTRPRAAAVDPLDGLKMRLTYRTVRVLMVVAERPGASNREIAELSGITDQGQISKLLGRLGRLELVENTGDGQEKGAANAWRLTPRGEAVERATRPR
jgi:AcrR family transcriptional regulator/DNA-binding MarR family transcriptional regulator